MGHRWRQLPGPVLDCEEVAAKISQLEEQLQRKRQAIDERDTVILELDHLAEFLTRRAAANLPGAVALGKEVSFPAR